MRKLIIILSIIFFILSGIITYKAVNVSQPTTRHEELPVETGSNKVYPEPEHVEEQPAGNAAKNEALVEELKATIAKLEEELSSKDKDLRATNKRPGKKTRVLAVLGGTFDSGQVAINEDMRNTFKELVTEILESPGYRVVIEGHTDNIPIKSSPGKRYMDNMELSFLRAKAVANALAGYGVSLERISVIGYGDTHPIAPNDTDEGRAKNRRVEIKLVPEDKEQ